MSVNKAILVGRLGKDPESFSPQSGGEIVKFSLATSERWKSKDGEKKERTEWHNIVIYNDGLAGVAKRFLSKGSEVYIEGKINTRKYTDKNGDEKYITEIIVDSFNGKIALIGGKSGGSSDEERPPSERKSSEKIEASRKEYAAAQRDLDDEVPF